MSIWDLDMTILAKVLEKEFGYLIPDTGEHEWFEAATHLAQTYTDLEREIKNTS